MSKLFLIVESYKPGKATEVYNRLQAQGMMLPDEILILDSWLESNMDRSFRIVKCDNAHQVDAWIRKWIDLMTFQVIPIQESEEVHGKIVEFLSDYERF